MNTKYCFFWSKDFELLLNLLESFYPISEILIEVNSGKFLYYASAFGPPVTVGPNALHWLHMCALRPWLTVVEWG